MTTFATVVGTVTQDMVELCEKDSRGSKEMTIHEAGHDWYNRVYW